MNAATITTALKPFDPARQPSVADEYGFWTHPDVPNFEGTDEVRVACAAMGCECSFEEGPDDIYLDDGLDYDREKVLNWQPAKFGWQLVSKYDTEDGPWAMFVRAIPTRDWIVWDQGSGDTTVYHLMCGRDVLATFGREHEKDVERLASFHNLVVAAAADDQTRLIVHAAEVLYAAQHGETDGNRENEAWRALPPHLQDKIEAQCETIKSQSAGDGA